MKKGASPVTKLRLKFHQEFYLGLEETEEFRRKTMEEEREIELSDSEDVDMDAYKKQNNEEKQERFPPTTEQYEEMLRFLDEEMESFSEKDEKVAISAEMQSNINFLADCLAKNSPADSAKPPESSGFAKPITAAQGSSARCKCSWIKGRLEGLSDHHVEDLKASGFRSWSNAAIADTVAVQL